MKSTVFILMGAVLWGIIGLFIRRLTPLGFSAMQLVALRSYVTLIGLLLLRIGTDPKKWKISLRHLPLFLGTGLASFLFFNTCYLKTMDYASLSVAAILLYTAPFFVMAMSALLFGERITAGKLTAAGIAFLGCVLVSGIAGGGVRVSLVGMLWGLGAGFGYALYSIFAKFALKHYDTLTVITYTFAVAAAGATLLCDPAAMLATLALHPQSIGLLILYGLLTGAAAYYCYTKGLEHTPPGKAAVLATAEPVVATLCGLSLGERLGIFGCVGIVLVIAAVLLLQRQQE